MSTTRKIAFAAMAAAIAACAGPLEEGSRTRLKKFETHHRIEQEPPDTPTFAGALAGYLAFALKHSPDMRAAFESWRASTLGIRRSRRLPEPTLSFGYFIRSVETRVGPQRFKVGISQTFPWPTRLSAAADAASEQANSAGRAVDAEILRIKRDVVVAYWSLWFIEQEHGLKSEHDAVLESLAGAIRGRLRTGAASLAELNQIELGIARHHDHRGAHREARSKASAALVAAIGATGHGQELPVTDTPIAGLPVASEAALREKVRTHPRILRHDHLAWGQQSRARAERADRFPTIRLGVEFIETGDAAMAGVNESGKDPLIVSAGLSIPLWAGSYSDAEQSARAAARAHRAEADAATRRAEAAFAATISDIRDAQRRMELYQKTLVPQAESTFQAVLGGYQTGRGAVASVILAQRDLLELQIEHARARFDHARAWARLEYIVGAEIDSDGGQP